MAGLVAIVATLHDPDLPALTRRAEVGVLISNAAPPVEGVLGPYLALLKTLTGGKALVSLTELSMQGTVCFERLFVGMQQVQHMSSEHSAPDAASAPATMWWEAVEGGVRAHVSRTRRLVMQGLDVDGSLARRFTGELRVLLAVRGGRLNREWFDVGALVQAAHSVKGVRALTARLTLTHTPDETEMGDGWGPEWSSDLTSSHLSSSEQSPELVAAGSKEALHLLLSRLQNISVLLGVTGDALASALWMAPGTLLIQVLPYGVKNHYGREYAVKTHTHIHIRTHSHTHTHTYTSMLTLHINAHTHTYACTRTLTLTPAHAHEEFRIVQLPLPLSHTRIRALSHTQVLGHAGPGNYMEIELPSSSAAFYPWTPHPTATSDSHLYWSTLHVMPCHIMSSHIISYHVMSCLVLSCLVLSICQALVFVRLSCCYMPLALPLYAYMPMHIVACLYAYASMPMRILCVYAYSIALLAVCVSAYGCVCRTYVCVSSALPCSCVACLVYA